MTILITSTLIGIIISFFFDRRKTFMGIKKGISMFLKILPAMLSIIIIISTVLYLSPKEMLLNYFGNSSGIMGYIFAALIGSITLIPGFIAYPVCGYLIKNGVSYPIVGVFVTTLMMVGIVTIPIEKKYFGLKVTLLRNALSLLGALLIGLLIGNLWKLI
ncbi:MAG TPA: permease [Ignavibacteriales bacterium]|nr:permease [Ignavibacteriales bacterium]